MTITRGGKMASEIRNFWKEGMAEVKRILVYSEMQSARLMLTFGALGWAAMLILPLVCDWGMFGFPNTPGGLEDQHNPYYVMAQMFPQIVWGVFFLAHGLFMGYSLAWKVDRAVHAIDAFCGAVLWVSMTWSMIVSHYVGGPDPSQPIPLVMECVASIMSIWWLTRIVIDREGYHARG